MPTRHRTSKKRPYPEPKLHDILYTYEVRDGTGRGLLSGTQAFADRWTARARWPEFRARVWASWAEDPRPVPPGGAVHFDGLGKQLHALMTIIPGKGVEARELGEAVVADVFALTEFEVPAEIAEPVAAYADELTRFANWLDSQDGKVPMDALAFGHPWR